MYKNGGEVPKILTCQNCLRAQCFWGFGILNGCTINLLLVGGVQKDIKGGISFEIQGVPSKADGDGQKCF